MKQNQPERSDFIAFGATVASALLLVLWTRELQPGWLAASFVTLAAAAVVLALRGPARPGVRAFILALGFLLGGIGAATVFTWQFDRLTTQWDDVRAGREAAVGRELGARMDDVVARGSRAARRVADIAAATSASDGTAALFRSLTVLRAEYGVDALAIYSAQGNLRAWAGQHRGRLPAPVVSGTAGILFEERPLFSYLYFQVPVPGRAEHAMAAILVETGILDETGEAGIADIVAARTDTRATFRSGPGTTAVWALELAGDTIVHARLEPLRQQEWRASLERTARRITLLAVAGALLALTVSWLRATGPSRPTWAAVLPLTLFVPIAAVAPPGAQTDLFSPLLFALPAPGDPSLGRLLVMLVPLAALAAGTRRSWMPRRVLLATAIAAAVVALAYPLLITLLLEGATPVLLRGLPAYWLGLQFAAVLLLAALTVLLLPRVEPETPPSLARARLLFFGALLLSAGLSAVLSMLAGPDGTVRPLAAVLWAVPFALGLRAVAPFAGRVGGLSRWLLSGWLAATAVLPHLWQAHVRAELDAAEVELGTLGVQSDPLLEYLLGAFSERALTRSAAGEEGVQLLYRSWVASGLAQEDYPVRIMLWAAGTLELALDAPVPPDVQLGSAPVPQIDRTLLDSIVAVRDVGVPGISRFAGLPDLSRMLTVPLPDGQVITVMVPPRRSLDGTSAAAPFLGAISSSGTRLNLVELRGLPRPPQDSVLWERTLGGWRSEVSVQYPDGWYHAHLSAAFPATGVRLARGALLVTFDLALMTLLWVLAVAARGGSAVPRGDWTGWLGTFRARITVALFGFFLVPTAVFGWVAYSALAGEVARAAETVASHSVAQAVREFQEGNSDLRDLAAHAGTDVLRYTGGELIDVSSREALDLGAYNAWMSPQVFQRLESGEEQAALEQQSLGGQSYVTAYHALRASGTLGVPMSLTTGDTARRQREFAHLVLFAVVLGALLSLALSVAVGRALAGPISLLRRASAAVGAGSLRIRLPEKEGGEFGQVYASFNRMIRRLRRARAREVRTARVLAWGEMARQVAHEIKNPLTPIKLSVQHLRRAYNDRHPQFEQILDGNVDQILSEIDRLSDIARAFSRYGAPSLAEGPLERVDIHGAIREALTLYRSGDERVRYVEEVEPGLPPACARANELKEVLLNLVENSRSAFDGGGTVIVRAFQRDNSLDIEVADNGPGIPPDFLPRVFEPHFSTRSSGTGLGLAIVRRLVESWGGTVTAESEVDVGTIVTVRLQRAG